VASFAKQANTTNQQIGARSQRFKEKAAERQAYMLIFEYKNILRLRMHILGVYVCMYIYVPTVNPRKLIHSIKTFNSSYCSYSVTTPE
jgi:hypothetical protein